MKYQPTKRTDFRFIFSGYGHYKVTYTSPITNKSWSKTISDMEIVDKIKGEDSPTQRDLNQLKRMIKSTLY